MVTTTEQLLTFEEYLTYDGIDKVFLGSQQIVSQIFSELTLTVEQVLAAGEI